LRIEPNSKGGGNQIFVLLDDGTIVGFSHTKWMDGMQEGDEVYAGQQVGESDGSGTTEPHTHMSVYPPGTPIDEITAPPVLKGQAPSERYYAARKPSQNPDDHQLDDPARGLHYKRLQINPFAPGQFYGDRRQGSDFLAPRAVR
jgi:murein DD-endopeptidase MepM/ murein hydrolase activator NlpD